jgi:hypothetical protein
LATHGTVIILHLVDFDPRLADFDATLQAGFAATAITGQDLDTVQGRNDALLYAAGIESFVALERSIGPNQHLLQASQFETGETVPQHVIPEGAIHSDPTLQGRLREFGLQLLESWATGTQTDERRPGRRRKREFQDFGGNRKVERWRCGNRKPYEDNEQRRGSS